MQILNRVEMKSILAGSDFSCLICHTPGGTEEWKRSPEGDSDDICEGIYPAYDEGDVSGSWGVCSELQEA
ncbi:MAG: hypothetical protein GVY07_03135 [Bacteroidetes bacterium]|jgi:hypothetical protein|nr:hypothetical protein [Bacteroidota bacterium]